MLRLVAVVAILCALCCLSVYDAMRHPVEPDEFDLAARGMTGTPSKQIWGIGE